MNLTAHLRHRLAPYPSTKQLIKFSMVGSTSAVIHFLILFIITEWLGVWYLISNGIGFVVSATFNFTANKLWTFRNQERGREVVRQAARYATVLTTGLAINSAIIFSITEWLGLNYKVSWIFAALLVAGWNFGLNRLWTFRARPAATAPNLPKPPLASYTGGSF